jgi:DtxR family transcriptional regulator, Mn-dependent transcriptional regulator
MTNEAVMMMMFAAALAIVLWPKYGLAASLTRLRALIHKERLEHVLKHLHHCEFSGLSATLESLAGVLHVSRSQVTDPVSRLEAAGLLTTSTGHPTLTVAGRREALRVVRIHRLWETYFAHHSGMDETLWHDEADRREHSTTKAEIDRIDAQLGHPRFDPHGAPIPTPGGELPSARGQTLTSLAVNERGRVIHIEDEPRATYQQLVAQGITIGVVVRILECSPKRIRLEIAGEEHTVAPVIVGNVTIELLDGSSSAGVDSIRLSQLAPGRKGRVVRLLPTCRGIQRRRLLDLGLVSGTVVESELRSGMGDPTAYRIRSALIALRQDEAKHVQIEQLTG